MTSGFNFSLVFRSADDTARFASALAPRLGAGDVILLSGGLGSGKTHFARALIQARLQAAGISEDVPSPTFTLVQVYSDGETEIWHCDLYRLSGPEEVLELGLEEAFTNAICLVEWPDRLAELTPLGALAVQMDITEQEDQRRATFQSDDLRWSHILPEGFK